MSADRELWTAVARTRLGMSLHDLEVGLDALKKAEMPAEAEVVGECIWRQTNLLHSWPEPVRDQVRERAS